MTGYKIPPTHSQFKPGQSGNIKGRPKGRRNTYSVLDDLLNQKIQVTQDGNQIKINKKTAILLQAVNRAVKGDIRAIQHIFPHMLAVDENNEHLAAVRQVLSTNDRAILENLKNRLITEQTKEEIDV